MSSDRKYPDQAIRDALFEHDIFNSKQRGNVRFGQNSFRHLEAAWAFEQPELLVALDGMRAEGLVEFSAGTYASTSDGRIAREQRWQEKGLRHPSLTSASADLKDVLVALTMTGGRESAGQDGGVIDVQELDIFLPNTKPGDLEKAISDLINEGLLERGRHTLIDGVVVIALSAEGRRHYVHRVIARLGIIPPRTILVPVGSEPLLFDNIGLPHVLADNLRYRWEEAERCEAARAWLAANILYGSILEVTLRGWLERNEKQALAADSAPGKTTLKGTQHKPLPQWRLHDLISVATEIGLLDQALTRHAIALRQNRNLVHPSLQVEERSNPDAALTAVSKQVVLAVIAAVVAAP